MARPGEMTVRRRSEHADRERFGEHDYDDDHETTVEYDEAVGMPHRRRGRCTCGWHGPWRRGRARFEAATADADQHANDLRDESHSRGATRD